MSVLVDAALTNSFGASTLGKQVVACFMSESIEMDAAPPASLIVCICVCTQLEEILMTGGKVTGVRLSKADQPEKIEELPCQAVILATGGYSASKELLKVCCKRWWCVRGDVLCCKSEHADQSSIAHSLLSLFSSYFAQQHNPTAACLPTTNGPWATGDALDIVQRAGARLIDLSEVQIHPTGAFITFCVTLCAVCACVCHFLRNGMQVARCKTCLLKKTS